MENYRILIPAYNAAKYLPELFKRIATVDKLDRVLVVSDGSTDKTVSVCEEHQVKVIGLKSNGGKGHALKAGFKQIIADNNEFFITIDADLQHDTKFIPAFIQKFSETQADVIIGSRLHDVSGMPKDRFLSNKITTALLSLLAGRKLPDSQSGYRLLSTKTVKEIDLSCNRYEMESELLVKAARAGLKIDSIPISTVYNGEDSYMHKVKDTYRFIKMYFMLFLIR